MEECRNPILFHERLPPSGDRRRCIQVTINDVWLVAWKPAQILQMVPITLLFFSDTLLLRMHARTYLDEPAVGKMQV